MYYNAYLACWVIFSADDIMEYYYFSQKVVFEFHANCLLFFFSSENKLCGFMQIASLWDNLHKISKPISKKNKKTKFSFVIC